MFKIASKVRILGNKVWCVHLCGNRLKIISFNDVRQSHSLCSNGQRGLVLGVYDGCCPGEFKLSPTAQKFDECVKGKLTELVKGTKISLGKAQVFGNLGDEFFLVAVAGLGPESATTNTAQGMDECKEFIRIATGVGSQALQDQSVGNILVEEVTNAEAAAEGSALGIWRYQDWKKHPLPNSTIELYTGSDQDGWIRGLVKAEAQNIARQIEEVPGNLMSPAVLSRFIQENLCPCGVTVETKDKDWIDTQGFHAYQTMAKGSCEPPVMIEMKYCGVRSNEKPVVLSGKAATFDSGGLCLKACRNMSMHRADLAGAAVIVGVFRAISRMRLPINVTALIAAYENMPSGMAVKPGDVVMARNGKTIRIENTDNDGRVVLADVLSYSAAYQPCLVMNIATTNPGLASSLGAPPNGIFSTSDIIWWELHRAGMYTGDRVWRLPFWKFFRSRVTGSIGVDTTNVGRGPGGYPCLAAAFLLEFVPPCVDFVHVDISGTGLINNNNGMPYLRKQCMSGRPVRTVVQFLYQIACPHEHIHDC